jgi:protein-S-isoprenylcysteine O-methyltransferase Ste14
METNSGENIFKTTRKVINVAVAMSGLRLDAGRTLFAWIPLLFASVWLFYQAKEYEWLVAYSIGAWACYYIGISLILGTRFKRVVIAKFGEKKATRFYDMIFGLLFFNVGLGVAAAALHTGVEIPLPLALRWSLFVLLTVVGFGIKFWATWIVGIDTYYFRDLLVEKSHGEFTVRGPYKKFANPMYGTGNIHAYGPALVTGSLMGLVFALACHIGIYSFYFIVEKPFIRRTYPS